jgi:hypothetical protein
MGLGKQGGAARLAWCGVVSLAASWELPDSCCGGLLVSTPIRSSLRRQANPRAELSTAALKRELAYLCGNQ